MPTRRNRRKSPAPSPLGVETLAQWQANAANLEWAATDPRFRRIYSVATLERINAFAHAPMPPGCIVTEQARYGIQLGYEACLRVIASMAAPAPVEAVVDEQPSFPPADNDLHEPAHTT
jgi:hypothetical protein